MKTKRCSKCGKIKPVSEFSKDKSRKDGLQSQCKSCAKQYNQDHKEERKQYDKQYNQDHKEERKQYNQDHREEKKQYKQDHKEEIKQYHRQYNQDHREEKKQYYQDHKEEIKQYDKQYKQDHKEKRKQYDKQYKQDHKEEIKQYHRQYYQDHKEERKQYDKQYNQDHREEKKQYDRQYENKKYKTDTTFRLRRIISKAIRKSIKRNKNGYHWGDLVGYTLDDLKQHLEKQFKDGMSWDNYGNWHIDHVIPQSWFKFKSYDDPEFKLCWCLGNLQPLWAKENISKNGNLVDKYIKDVRLTNEV
jgi:hypothetical protein